MDKPNWLKIMENGSIGEATAKEFLIDRFWILERSVDIQGADLIIQRRLTRENILDKTPPKFGVVQVKYFQDENTTQYIPKDYILDSAGKTRTEFFILIVTGVEDSKKLFLLTTENVCKEFDLIDDKEKTHYGSYSLPGIKLFRSTKYLITHKKTTLDIIENKLNLSSFESNRRFFSNYIPKSEVNTEIATPFIIDVANDQADFKKWQNEIKEEVRYMIVKLEDTTDILNEILKETDPLKIEELLDSLDYYDRYRELRYSFDIDRSFFEEARCFKRKHDQLVEDGFLQNFVKSQESIENEMLKFTHKDEKIEKDDVLIFDINYDGNFKLTQIKLSVIKLTDEVDKPERFYKGAIIDNEKQLSYGYIPDRHIFATGKGLETKKYELWSEHLKVCAKSKSRAIMNHLYDKKYDV